MISLRCKKHPKRKYLSPVKKGTCPACEDIYHLITETIELPGCWAFDLVLEGRGR